MAVNLITVTGNVESITGTTPALARVWFILIRPAWNSAGEVFVQNTIEAVADAGGAFSVTLQCTDDFEHGEYYTMSGVYRDAVTQKDRTEIIGSFYVPTGGPYTISALLGDPSFPTPVLDSAYQAILADIAALEVDVAADEAALAAHIADLANPHAVTKTQVGLSNVDNTSDANKPVSTATQTALDLKANLANPTFTGSVGGITKAMVGLSNVDNTSDANKPVSTATQTALDLKADDAATAAALATKAPLASPTFTGTVAGVSKAMVGLGNVDNTSDLAKPISTATQTALDLKADDADLTTVNQRLSDLADVRVTLRNANPGLNYVLIDRGIKKIYFPRMEIAFPNNTLPANADDVSPAAATGFFEADFSIDLTNRYHYYADIPNNQVVTVNANKPSPATVDLVPIGSSHNGAFNNFRGFRVIDPGAELGRNTSAEGLQRTSENVPTNGVQTGRIPFVINTAKWFQLQPVHSDMRYLCNSAGKIDLSYMTDGTTATIIGTNTLQLFAGNGRTFVGTVHNNLSLTTGGAVRVTRVSDYILAEPLAGAPTFSTIAHPVMEMTILQAGQSQHVQGHQYGLIGGFSEGARDTDWMTKGVLDESRFWINGATGGTALLRDSISSGGVDEGGDLDAWWYDDVDTLDGPALLNCYAQIDAAIALGQPVPELVFWAQGESDAGALQTGTNGVTQARYEAAVGIVLLKIHTYLVAKGATDPQFIITMLGSWDGSALRFATSSIRRSYLNQIAVTDWMHQGPEMFDLPRYFRQIHMNEMGNYIHGKRLLRSYANAVLLAVDNQYPSGPVCGTAVPGADGQSVTIPIASPAGTVINYPFGDVSQYVSVGTDPNFEGGAPFGFAIINTDTKVVRRITAQISGNNVILRADVTLTANDRVFFPAGYLPEKARFQFIRDNQLDRRTNTPGLPLRSYVSAPLA